MKKERDEFCKKAKKERKTVIHFWEHVKKEREKEKHVKVSKIIEARIDLS